MVKNQNQNKVVVFTQTYHNNRHALFDYHDKDSLDIRFRNAFDKTVYAFHNSPQDYVQEILYTHSYFQELDNLEVIQYNHMSYPETFRQTLQKCKNEGFDYMIFLQDDVLSTGHTPAAESYLDSLIEFIHTQDFDMLHLENYVFKFESDPDNYPTPPLRYSSLSNDHEFKVYENHTKHFEESGQWAMDDGPFVAKIDFLLDLYDASYFQYMDIWQAEGYINEKSKKHPFVRLTCSHKFFRRYNAVGPNSWNAVNEFKDLSRIFTTNLP